MVEEFASILTRSEQLLAFFPENLYLISTPQREKLQLSQFDSSNASETPCL
jgi:hypothetical protein